MWHTATAMTDTTVIAAPTAFERKLESQSFDSALTMKPLDHVASSTIFPQVPQDQSLQFHPSVQRSNTEVTVALHFLF